MTYFGFLARFLGVPLLGMILLTWKDARSRRGLPESWGGAAPWAVVLGHVLVAVIYTTPWDNYLVATNVWWYPPERVVGLTLGWVPIEEYTFFVLQSLLAGLWLLWLARRLPVDQRPIRYALVLRIAMSSVLGILLLTSAVRFFSGDGSFTYMGLILLWALPPIMIQTLIGGEILWRNRYGVGAALASLVLYLSVADFLAIGDGIWTIDPAQSLQIYLGGVLPLEEFVFFLVTSTLLVFGVTLVSSTYSDQRVKEWLRQLIGDRGCGSRRILPQ